MSVLVDKVSSIIEPSLDAMGYSVVQVRLMEGKGARTLQIMAERRDSSNMSVDDCEKISHTVSALLDVEDPIQGAYNLEVSSPGIDRPLVKPEDFARHTGYQVKIETKLPINNRRRFTGTIVKAEGGKVEIDSAGEMFALAHDNIQHAKLVLTDELIREHLRQHKKETKH